MSVLVLLEFPVRRDNLPNLQSFLDGILPATKAAKGFQDLRRTVDDNDPPTVILIETWESRDAFDEYFAWRRQNGDIGELAAHLDGPPEVRVLTLA